MAHWKLLSTVDDFFNVIHADIATDVTEDNDNIIVEMYLPGIEPDHVTINVENHYLHVSGSREEKKEKKERHFYRKEIKYGSFERVIPLPCVIDEKNTKAEYEDGILKIVLPKNGKPITEKIKIHKK